MRQERVNLWLPENSGLAGFRRPGLEAGLTASEGRCLPGEGPRDGDPCAPVNSEQVGACWGLLALPAPEMRVRPLQVEKSGSGLYRPDCKNATGSRISGSFRRAVRLLYWGGEMYLCLKAA